MKRFTKQACRENEVASFFPLKIFIHIYTCIHIYIYIYVYRKKKKNYNEHEEFIEEEVDVECHQSCAFPSALESRFDLYL